MLLYHGTSTRYLDAIMRDGLVPRRTRKDKQGNWKHTITSCPSAVYLTNAYAVFYAQQATEKDDKLAVLEIDMGQLSSFRLTPDEDFLEQVSRKQDVTDAKGKTLRASGEMKRRTIWFRNRLLDFSHLYKNSLEHLGNCCYHGVVPASTITRVATLPTGCRISFMVDPTMTLLNYRIMGGYYRELTKYVFGDTVDMSQAMFPDQLERLLQIPRDEVQIMQVNGV